MNTPAPAFTDPAARRLGKRIRARRAELGMTQLKLAEISGLSQSSISTWEAGRKRPNIDSLVSLRDALGVTPAEFADWIELLGHRAS